MENVMNVNSEQEYDVTVLASFTVIAKSQEDANDYILEQFCGGNTEYTSGVEIKEVSNEW